MNASAIRSTIRGCCGALRWGIASLLIPIGLLESASAQTTITFPWDWHISVAPNIGSPTNPVPGEVPVPIWLWGNATMQFGQPVNVGEPTAPPTFDLGPGGIGFDIQTAQPPPMGGIYEISIELVSMELHSMMPAAFPGGTTDVILRESPTRASSGMIRNLRNLGNGTVAMDSFFDIFYDVDLRQLGMSLTTQQPTQVGMRFDTVVPDPPTENMVMAPLPERDILWAPTWIWRTYPPGTAPPWVDPAFHPWDWPVTIHGHVTPEPSAIVVAVWCVVCGVAAGRTRCRS